MVISAISYSTKPEEGKRNKENIFINPNRYYYTVYNNEVPSSIPFHLLQGYFGWDNSNYATPSVLDTITTVQMTMMMIQCKC